MPTTGTITPRRRRHPQKISAQALVASPLSSYLHRLRGLTKAEQVARAEFIRRVNAEYTPAVCAETLRINEEYPIHDSDS